MRGNSGYHAGDEYTIAVKLTQPAAGDETYVSLDFGGTIIGWTILANRVGSISIDIRRASLLDWEASGVPGAAATICGSSPPALSGAAAGRAYPTDWSTTLPQGDCLAFHVVSVATITNATLLLRCRR
jgi:hypothetical protein